jgi:hypothetical protein
LRQKIPSKTPSFTSLGALDYVPKPEIITWMG